MNTNQIKRCKPKYTLEFKQDAARLVLEKGYTHQQAADNLGISLSAIGRWVRAERGSTTEVVLNLTDQTELVRLRRENEQLRMEREIIKKAAVFFAKEIGWSTGLFESNRRPIQWPYIMPSDAGEHQCLLYVA